MKNKLSSLSHTGAQSCTLKGLLEFNCNDSEDSLNKCTFRTSNGRCGEFAGVICCE